MNNRDDAVAEFLRAAFGGGSHVVLDRSLGGVQRVVDVIDPVSGEELIACALSALLVAASREPQVDDVTADAVARLRRMLSAHDELLVAATRCARTVRGLEGPDPDDGRVTHLHVGRREAVKATLRSDDLPFRSTAIGWKSNVFGQRQPFPLGRFVAALAPRSGDVRFMTLMFVNKVHPGVPVSGLSYVLDIHETADQGLLGFWFKINERWQVLSSASFNLTADSWRSEASIVRRALIPIQMGPRACVEWMEHMRHLTSVGEQRTGLWWVSAGDPEWGKISAGGQGVAPRALISAIAACNRLLEGPTVRGGVDGWRRVGSGWRESHRMAVWAELSTSW